MEQTKHENIVNFGRAKNNSANVWKKVKRNNQPKLNNSFWVSRKLMCRAIKMPPKLHLKLSTDRMRAHKTSEKSLTIWRCLFGWCEIFVVDSRFIVFFAHCLFLGEQIKFRQWNPKMWNARINCFRLGLDFRSILLSGFVYCFRTKLTEKWKLWK